MRDEGKRRDKRDIVFPLLGTGNGGERTERIETTLLVLYN
jgi:hypothetical protein